MNEAKIEINKVFVGVRINGGKNEGFNDLMDARGYLERLGYRYKSRRMEKKNTVETWVPQSLTTY